MTLYIKPGCSFYAAARSDLMNRGVSFEEIDIYAVEGARDRLVELSGGRMIVPVIMDEYGSVSVAPKGG